MQIYGEAQTCLHKVVFDANNAEPAYSSLPVPSHGDFDQSYEYEQDAQNQLQEAERQRHGSKRESSSREAGLSGNAGQFQTPYNGQQQSFAAGQPNLSASQNAPAFQPLSTPAHVGLENDFSDAVNATWREQEVTSDQHTPYIQSQGITMHPIQAISGATHTQTPSASHAETQSREDPYGGAEYSREEDDNEPEYVDESQMPPRVDEPQQEREGITTIEEETRSALQSTEVSSSTGRGIGGFSNPSAVSSDGMQRHQLHDRPVPPDPDRSQDEDVRAVDHYEPNEVSRNYIQTESSGLNQEVEHDTRQNFEPSGDDLYGTGLYGATASENEGRGTEPTEGVTKPLNLHRDTSPRERAHDIPTIAEPEPEPVPVYTATPTIQHAPSPPPHDPAAQTILPPSQPTSANTSRQVSPRQAQSPDLSAASALAAAAASSIRPRQGTQGSSKSIPKQQNAPAPPQHLYTTVATSNGKSPTSPVTPSSPTRRDRTPPVKQNSYRSDHNKRHDSNEGTGRSSIAYLNDTPNLEPPMRAPPPVNLGMPLPSSSPYFNPYANLRSSSGGPGDFGATGGGLANSTNSGRPKGARTSVLDTTLGSKHGFDMRSVQQAAHERPLLQQPSPNTNLGAVREKDYSYAIRTGDDGGGRRLAAGAFRRANPSTSSIPSFRSGNNEDATSPAQRLRDEWRMSQPVLPPNSEFVTPAQTPSGLPLETPGSGYIDVGEDMYGERADSRAPLSHRTSAIDAPMDVMPNDDQSHSDLAHIAEGNEESVQPLNVKKKSPASTSAEFPRPSENESFDESSRGQTNNQLS